MQATDDSIEIADELVLTVKPDGFGFDIPNWWINTEGSLTRMTPYATDIVHSKQPGSIAPFTRKLDTMGRHYAFPEDTFGDVRHPKLAPNLLRLYEWRGVERYYRIVVEDLRSKGGGSDA